MTENILSLSRRTKETSIRLALRGEPGCPVKIDTGVPFFDHMLTAAAFHGGFGLEIEARGDLEVDYHHLVEDTGLVLGEAFHQLLETRGAVARFGHSVIPMDDALGKRWWMWRKGLIWFWRRIFPRTAAAPSRWNWCGSFSWPSRTGPG